MGWNGSGSFNRIFSWVADKAAGLDISSSRMDTDTNDIAANGLGNCLTRDGQGQPSANLPMAGFRHTVVQNAVNRTDYSAFGQIQDGLVNWTVFGGTADALTATYTPALVTLNDGQLCFGRASASNATTTPTFAPNGLTARTITKLGGSALAVGDIPGNLAEIVLRYNSANTRWELLNPSNSSINNGTASTGVVWLTVASTPPTGWLMFDDGTFGDATSGSSNSNSAVNLALFNILFASPFTDTTCPLLTSTGAGTTRAAQGSAAAAWAANCRMTLPKMLGRALAVAGSGSGLTARTMGLTVGEETHLLALSETPAGIVSANGGNISLTVTSSDSGIVNNPAGVASSGAGGGGNGQLVGTSGSVGARTSTGNITAGNAVVTSTNTGGGAHNNMQPSQFLNAIVKL
jgi:microcystin-dependent protein